MGRYYGSGKSVVEDYSKTIDLEIIEQILERLEEMTKYERMLWK